MVRNAERELVSEQLTTNVSIIRSVSTYLPVALRISEAWATLSRITPRKLPVDVRLIQDFGTPTMEILDRQGCIVEADCRRISAFDVFAAYFARRPRDG